MTTTDDLPPSLAERYAVATSSSRLVADADERTDLDYLIAAGVAAKDKPERIAALKVLRMVETQRLDDLHSVVEHYDAALATYLSRGSRRQIPRAGRRALIVQVLNWQMHKGCDFCSGAGLVPRDVDSEGREAYALTMMCDACHGSGIKPLSRAMPSFQARIGLWLVDQMNMHAKDAIKHMRKLLAREEPKP